MSFAIRDAAAAVRHIGAASLRTVAGTAAGDLKKIDQIRLRKVDGTNPADLSEVYKQGIRLAVSPTDANGASSAKTGPIYTNSVTVGVAGGTPPYTHSWVATGGISPNAPTSATTAFIGVPPGVEGEIDGEGTDTVTDANGLTNTITVPISIVRG